MSPLCLYHQSFFLCLLETLLRSLHLSAILWTALDQLLQSTATMATICLGFLGELCKCLVFFSTWVLLIFITTIEGNYSYPHFADEMKASVSTCPKLLIGWILALNYDLVMYKVPTPQPVVQDKSSSTAFLCESAAQPMCSACLPHQRCFLLSASGFALSLSLNI